MSSAHPAHALPDYAELHCLTNFSFQRGASHPAELVQRAAELGYTALAITDECSVAGVVRAHTEAKKCGLSLIVGSEFAWGDLRLVALARDAEGWGNLCEFITAARQAAPKGEYRLHAGTDFALLRGCEVLLAPRRDQLVATDLIAVKACFSRAQRLFSALGIAPWLAVEQSLAPDDGLWLTTLEQVGDALGLPLVAAGDVHMHVRGRKRLQDVVTAVRLGRPVADCGFALQPNAERHLRARMRLAAIYPPVLLAATLTVASRCKFSLDEIRYRYPKETVPDGMTPGEALAWYTEQGAQGRYPTGVPEAVCRQIATELEPIAHCRYEMYFLTVHDIVRYARSQGILCQGHGSAANSAVCFCLGITAVDPGKTKLLFERFISKERDEPPDIDVDFEYDRREDVIQYIYTKYGRERAAITAVVISYRTRSALRDVGKALGVAPALIDAFAKDHHWFDETIATDRLQELADAVGVPLAPHIAELWLKLARDLKGFPRHLSQHVGGFVLTEGKLTRLVPVEPASMDGRSIIQWDKDDLEWPMGCAAPWRHGSARAACTASKSRSCRAWQTTATARISPCASSSRSRASANTAFPKAMPTASPCWFKRHEPACFLAALLNAQPMGFYTPSQLVQDAVRHGIRVLPIDVVHSDWESTLEGEPQPVRGVAGPQPAARRAPGAAAGGGAGRGRRRAAGQGARRPGIRKHRRPGLARPAGPARAAGPGGGRCAALFVRPPAPAGLGRRRAMARAGAAARRCGERGSAGPGRSARGRRDFVRLRRHRPHAAPPSARPAARPAGSLVAAHRPGAARHAQRAVRACLRHRHRPAAAGVGQGHDVHHAGRRDRARQRHRLAIAGGNLAQCPAAIAPAGGGGPVAVQPEPAGNAAGTERRGAPSGRPALQGHDPAARPPGAGAGRQPGFPLRRGRSPGRFEVKSGSSAGESRGGSY
ncbi:hypothetical protein AVHM3334_00275 [Acidovorax sp. SUPP3334]|nr:hypothetical protein AVHM3334_00275 [Acidovorax sp. SUPP3334]